MAPADFSGRLPIAATAVDLGGPVPPRPGVTLRQYCEILESQGRLCFLSPDGNEAWVMGQAHVCSRTPNESTEPPDKSVLRLALRQRGVWIATFLLVPSSEFPANCFGYVCRDQLYTVEGLEGHVRRDIRRGLRSFEVRRTTAEEIAEYGYQAQVDTDTRHGYTSLAPEEFRKSVFIGGHMPYLESWGAWKDGKLAAFIQLLKIDNWVRIGAGASVSSYLSDCPNNALLYQVTRQMLSVERRAYVSYGLSALRVGTNELAMHRYKTRMGYEPIPLCRRFCCAPWVKPIVSSPLARSVWEWIATMRPQSQRLQMVAGLSRLLGARAPGALDWAKAGVQKPSGLTDNGRQSKGYSASAMLWQRVKPTKPGGRSSPTL
jgi:hypothetical protein